MAFFVSVPGFSRQRQGTAISGTGARDAMIAFDQVRAMTWRLFNPRS